MTYGVQVLPVPTCPRPRWLTLAPSCNRWAPRWAQVREKKSRKVLGHVVVNLAPYSDVTRGAKKETFELEIDSSKIVTGATSASPLHGWPRTQALQSHSRNETRACAAAATWAVACIRPGKITLAVSARFIAQADKDDDAASVYSVTTGANEGHSSDEEGEINETQIRCVRRP